MTRHKSTRTRTAASPRPASPSLTLDEAFMALLIGAMDANRHVSREELARAHHLIWFMKRYRRKSGDHVNRLVDRARTIIEEQGALPVVAAAARMIPVRLRPAAFALSADLVLADGKMEPAERRFLSRLAGNLALDPKTAAGLLDAILVKNSA